MKSIITAAALAALFCAVSPLSAQVWEEDGPGFLKFGRGHSIQKRSEDITVHVGMIYADKGSDAENVWFLATVQGVPWTSMRFRWAEGVSCPAAFQLLKQVRNVEMPAPLLPLRGREDEEHDIKVDGRFYSLAVDSSSVGGQASGRMYMESNTDTDLAKWIDGMLAALAPCWSNKVPEGASEKGGKSDILP